MIPFNKPFIAGKELYYIAQAVTMGNIAGDGHFTRACSRLLEERFGAGRVLLVPSGTAALELAAMLCDLQPGDEVIMPSYTFVSTASAFVRCGARPVFVEIRPDTLNLDESRLPSAITPRSRAIVPVHYAGLAGQIAVPGYASTIVAILVLGGLQLLALGLLGEYLGRVHLNLNQRPQYTIRQILPPTNPPNPQTKT